VFFRRLVVTVDSHTQGEPTRLVIGGIIHYPGQTMREKQAYVAREYDPIRKALMGEPRGHRDMFGGYITPPATESGDLGIIYMDNSGYLDMCGHGTIGLCTAVVELGLVQPHPPRTEIQIDTPAGRVTGYALSTNGQVTRAGFRNVPSFCLSPSECIEVEGIGRLEVGIAYGGNFFAIVPATAAGVALTLDNMAQLRQVGMKIKHAANTQLTVQHPTIPEVSGIDIVTFYGLSDNPKARYKNVHIFANGQVDRSPGGTGTSGMLAYLIARGKLQPEETVVAEGLAGGLFEGRMAESWREGEMIYYTPEISGTAYLTGIHQFSLDLEYPTLERLRPSEIANL